MIILTIISLFAGFFTGLSTCLVYLHVESRKAFAKCEAERKLWTNKALIRDGQTKLFPDAMIETGIDSMPSEKTPPIAFRSPFRKGIVDLREKVAEERKAESGSKLPVEIQEQIAEAAKAAKLKTA